MTANAATSLGMATVEFAGCWNGGLHLRGSQVIRSFRSKELEKFWQRGDVRRIPTDWAEKIEILLDMIDAAEAPEDIAVSGLSFHAYRDGATERFAVMASMAWRLSFAWDEQDAVNVDLEQVH